MTLFSQLPADSALTGVEELLVKDGSTYKRATVAQVVAAALASPSLVELIEDSLAGAIQPGTGITWVYDDTLGRLTPTVTVTGGVTSVAGRTGDVVIAAADVASGVLAPARLGSGTPDATKFARGDGAWAVPPSSLPLARQLLVDTTATTALNTTSTTDAAAYTVSASPWIAAGDLFHGRLAGYLLNLTGGAATVKFGFAMQGTSPVTIQVTVPDTSAANGGAGAASPFSMDFYISKSGTNQEYVCGNGYYDASGDIGNVSVFSTPGAIFAGANFGSRSTSVASTVLSLTYQRSSASSALIVGFTQKQIEILKIG